MNLTNKRNGLMVLILLFMGIVFNFTVAAETQGEPLVPAFPGAEGYGKYTTGGRGGEVYIVTNLNDSGEGSLRDAVSESNRTIVFEVSGNLVLDSPLRIKGDNITIAGQTAPGDGISVVNHSTYIEGNNIIIRYMTFRMGDQTESTADALSVRGRSDLIIDHSSMSWGIDEVASIYDMKNVTLQNSIVAEALHMTDHDKGRHGFGGIWGSSTSYLNNIIAHNSSRNPRFKGSLEDEGLDFRNNIVYNWNYKAGYGGNEGNVNMINNYYKYGPDTIISKRSEMVEPDGNSNWYVNGNHVYDYLEVTNDNRKGVTLSNASTVMLDTAVDVPHGRTRSAQEAYHYVLENAGAVIPRRDSIDARIIADVKNGTGRQINSIDEVGGWANLSENAEAPLDSNRDGIPDYWAEKHGIDPMNDDWAKEVNDDGYTNLEVYLNSITVDGHHNPEVKITSPSLNDLFEEGTSLTIQAEAEVEGATIEKVEFFVGAEKLGETTSAPYEWTWEEVPEGTHYVFARAHSHEGMQTDSTAIPIHVNGIGDISPWDSMDIGEVGIEGQASKHDDVYVIKGDGNLTAEEESLHFMYQKMSGDIQITAQILSDTKVAPHNREGVMIRESLDEGAPLAMSGISVRGDDRVGVFYHRENPNTRVGETDPIVGPTTPYWVRLTKVGDIITGFISEDGENWQVVSSMTFPDTDEVYVGLAVDAANENNMIRNLNRVEFTNVEVEELPPLPLYPQEFTISRGEDALHLSWSEAERATAYDVQRGTIKGGPYETIATVTDTEYTDEDVNKDLNYFYVIRARNDAGESMLTSLERNGALLGSKEFLTRLVDDDFEDYEIGTRVFDEYNARPNDDRNHVIVEEVSNHSVGNDSDKAVKLFTSGGTNTAFTRDFGAQTGKMVVEVDYMQEEMSTFARAIRVMNGGNNNVEIFTGDGRGCESEYCWYVRNQGDAVLIPENNQFTLNEWYHVRIEIDIPSEEFTIYVNDVFSGTLPFQGSANSLNRFESHTWGDSDQYLDNIRISTVGLEAPQELAAVLEDESVLLSWNEVEHADLYHIYRKKDDGYYELIGSVDTLMYEDELSEVGHYEYAVAAFNAGTGEGNYSERVPVVYTP